MISRTSFPARKGGDREVFAETEEMIWKGRFASCSGSVKIPSIKAIIGPAERENVLIGELDVAAADVLGRSRAGSYRKVNG